MLVYLYSCIHVLLNVGPFIGPFHKGLIHSMYVNKLCNSHFKGNEIIFIIWYKRLPLSAPKSLIFHPHLYLFSRFYFASPTTYGYTLDDCYLPIFSIKSIYNANSTHHKVFSITNIKSHIPIILDLERLNYDQWTKLSSTHFMVYNVNDHINDRIPKPITQNRRKLML